MVTHWKTSDWCGEVLDHLSLLSFPFCEMRESHFTAQPRRVLCEEISVEQIFNYMKAINIFGRV